MHSKGAVKGIGTAWGKESVAHIRFLEEGRKVGGDCSNCVVWQPNWSQTLVQTDLPNFFLATGLRGQYIDMASYLPPHEGHLPYYLLYVSLRL